MKEKFKPTLDELLVSWSEEKKEFDLSLLRFLVCARLSGEEKNYLRLK